MTKAPSRRYPSRVIGAILLLCAGLLSCARGAVHSAGDARGTAARQDLRPVVARWLRADKEIRDWITTIDVRAVFLAAELREAWAVTQARDLGRSPELAERSLAEARAAGAAGLDFLVAVYCGKKEWNDLAGKSSNWGAFLELEPEGKRLTVATVREEPVADAFAQRYLPDVISPWRKLYRFHFASPHRAIGELLDSSTRMDLVISGPLGQARMVWRFADAGESIAAVEATR
ncbi:MAG: hypothetical protein HYV63_04230 [Candidatus Schekmanbacteria bacterium]|nr:hypothetical protein [Candidatus Schekmanbacteria bacterium]